MVNAPEFNSLIDLDASNWLVNIKEQFRFDSWPNECVRCKQTELSENTSIRLNMVELDKTQDKRDYLMVGGVLDNLCNSACQMCNEQYSTRIGSLTSRTFPIVDNTDIFWQLPQNRITHLDLSGGEPSYSKNYKHILANLPDTIKSVRLNTNCSTVLTELESLVDRGIDVTVTVSFDGIGSVHDYIRWPITWDKFYNNLMTYQTMSVNLNLWTTVSALNVNNIDSITEFADKHGFDHSWSLLDHPTELNIKYKNHLTLTADTKLEGIRQFLATAENNQEKLDSYIVKQDQARSIKITDYIQ